MGKKHSSYIIALLFFFTLVLTFTNYFWIKNNLYHLPTPWDQSAYIYMSLNEYEALRHGDVIQFIKIVLKQAPNLAPLFPVTTIPFFVIFGLDIYAAYLANSIYLFILFLSVFFITERLAGRKAAILSVFIVATFPAVIAFSRDYLFEFPLAAMTALSYLFFLKSEAFQKKRYSILFGICAGLSLLTKTMGIVFFVLPLLYGIYIFIKAKTARKNIAYAFVSFLIVSAFYYVPNMQHIFGYLFYYGVGEGAKNYNVGISDIASLRYWTVYFQHIAERGISPGYLLIFIVSLISFLLTKKNKLPKDYILVWLWFIVGYILLSIPLNKGGERYALPILAPIAILLSAHITRISSKPLKYTIIVSAILVGVLNYTYQTDSEGCHYQPFFLSGIPVLTSVHTDCVMQEEVLVPYDKIWDVEQIPRAIEKLTQDRYETVHMLIAFDHHFLNINTLMLYQKIDKLKGISHINFTFERLPNNPVPEDEIKEIMDRSQVIITKNGFQGPDFSNRNNAMVHNLLEYRTPVKSFAMSDGSVLSIYGGINQKILNKPNK